MPTGTTLTTLLEMLKAEIGDEMDTGVSSANDTRYKRLLSNQQQWLATQHAFLLGKVTKDVALVAGTRLYALPSGINPDKLDKPACVKLDDYRFRVEYGIHWEHYNVYDSELNVQADPVMRWQLVNDNGTRKIEVWPIPATDQTLQVSGEAVITAMTQGSHTCVVDDLVLVYFTAAKIQARGKQADASPLLAQANAALNSVRGSRSSAFDRFSLKGAGCVPCQENRPMVGVGLPNWLRMYQGRKQILQGDFWYDFELVDDEGVNGETIKVLQIGQTPYP